MAKRSSARGGGRSPAKARTTTRTAEVEVVEESAGAGWESGVAVMTAIILLTACLMVDYALGTQYGAGMFFK